jgi:hypothetical protein
MLETENVSETLHFYFKLTQMITREYFVILVALKISSFIHLVCFIMKDIFLSHFAELCLCDFLPVCVSVPPALSLLGDRVSSSSRGVFGLSA